jgi:SNF2 family DNA or RNA helicase
LRLLPSKEIVIKCRSSIILNIFDGIINQEVKDMLLAEDIQGVVNYLGITSINNQDIVNVICSNMEKDLENAKLMYRAKEQMHYLNEQAKTESLQKAQEKITAIEGKINGVKQRIIESNIDPIMFVEIENPVITACCNNKFDLESITNYYDFQLKQTGRSAGINCPLCRKPLDLKKLMYIGESKGGKTGGGSVAASWVSEEHTKIENLEKILCNEIAKDKKILIFSEYEGNFDCYSKAFAKSGRNNLSAVKGSISHITNLLGKFNSGEIPCLFLNAKYCGSGLNLEKTDVVIIMHKMTQDNIKQVIGRAQRIGRQGQLEVFFLYAENE